jgi:hypothetical protein
VSNEELILAEFKSLRDEIHVRIQQQQLLVTLTVTAIGVLAAVTVDSKRDDLLLLIPIVTTTFGLMLLEHTRVIGALGDYINHVLGAENSHAVSLGQWERSDQRGRTKILEKVPMLVLPYVLLFVVCPVVAAVAALRSSDVDGDWEWVAWGELASIAVATALVIYGAWRNAKGAA